MSTLGKDEYEFRFRLEKIGPTSERNYPVYRLRIGKQPEIIAESLVTVLLFVMKNIEMVLRMELRDAK